MVCCISSVTKHIFKPLHCSLYRAQVVPNISDYISKFFFLLLWAGLQFIASYSLTPVYSQLQSLIPVYSQLQSLIPVYSQLQSLTPVYSQLQSLTPVYSQLQSLIPVYSQLQLVLIRDEQNFLK